MSLTFLTPNATLTSGGLPLVSDESVTFLTELIGTWDGTAAADAGLLGVPFDGCVSYRPGARFGPESVREALKLGTSYCVSEDVDFSSLKLVDCGDVKVCNDIIETQARVEAAVSLLLEREIVPVIIGGDHSISLPAIRALSRRKGGTRVGVIDFDAHFDSRDAPSGLEHSGMWATQILCMEGVPVAPSNLVQIGIGDFAYSRSYGEKLTSAGGSFFTPFDVRRRGMKAVCQEALAKATRDVDALYVTVDIDCLQQAFAPGTSVPNPVGLTPWELLEALTEICPHPLLRGFDLVEIAPPFDLGGMTSWLGAEIVRRVLCGLVQGVGGRTHFRLAGSVP